MCAVKLQLWACFFNAAKTVKRRPETATTVCGIPIKARCGTFWTVRPAWRGLAGERGDGGGSARVEAGGVHGGLRVAQAHLRAPVRLGRRALLRAAGRGARQGKSNQALLPSTGRAGPWGAGHWWPWPLLSCHLQSIVVTPRHATPRHRHAPTAAARCCCRVASITWTGRSWCRRAHAS